MARPIDHADLQMLTTKLDLDLITLKQAKEHVKTCNGYICVARTKEQFLSKLAKAVNNFQKQPGKIPEGATHKSNADLFYKFENGIWLCWFENDKQWEPSMTFHKIDEKKGNKRLIKIV